VAHFNRCRPAEQHEGRTNSLDVIRTAASVVLASTLFCTGCCQNVDSASGDKRAVASSSTGEDAGTKGDVRILAYNGSDLVMEFDRDASEAIYRQIEGLVQKKPSIGLPPIKMGADVRLEIKRGDTDVASYEIFGRSALSVVDGSTRSQRKVWADYDLCKSIVRKAYPTMYTTDE
jgi:hypothetical protein